MKKVLNVLILASLITSIVPICAESKAAYYGKKTAKVIWRTTEVLGGTLLGIIVGLALAEKGFKNDNGTPEYITPLFCVGVSASLLVNGLSGLNDELEIIDRIKCLRDKKATVADTIAK